MQNCLHIYTGDGKGKTTAAIGLAVRYLTYGGKVLFLQFMKGAPSGEINSLESLGARVIRLSKDYGFYPHLKDEKTVITEHNQMLTEAKWFARDGGLLILDECVSAYSLSLLCKTQLMVLLQSKSCEIVCTGRNAPTEFLNLADYITEMRSIRHPFEKGIYARPGIEF